MANLGVRCDWTVHHKVGGAPITPCSRMAQHRLPGGVVRCSWHTPEAMTRNQARHEERMQRRWSEARRQREAFYAQPVLTLVRMAIKLLRRGEVKAALALLEPVADEPGTETDGGQYAPVGRPPVVCVSEPHPPGGAVTTAEDAIRRALALPGAPPNEAPERFGAIAAAAWMCGYDAGQESVRDVLREVCICVRREGLHAPTCPRYDWRDSRGA